MVAGTLLPMVDTRLIAFAVARGRVDVERRRFAPTEIHGTAIPIAPGLFLTAAHVALAAGATDTAAIGQADDRGFAFYPVVDVEMFEAVDLAVLKANVPPVRPVVWSVQEAELTREVMAIGYPYALNTANNAIEVRALTGTIVSGTNGYELRARPRVYELSFPCPRGLSGAALTLRRDAYCALGVILGNRSTDMVVYSENEIGHDGTSYYSEKVESLRLGYALQAEALLAVDSRLLGGPLARS
jgi:Trypsin-like peptidase domain